MAAFEVPTMDESQLFLVHVWPPKPGFRASARRVDSDQPQLLNSPQELACYFAHASSAAVVASCLTAVTAPAADAHPPQPLGGSDE